MKLQQVNDQIDESFLKKAASIALDHFEDESRALSSVIRIGKSLKNTFIAKDLEVKKIGNHSAYITKTDLFGDRKTQIKMVHSIEDKKNPIHIQVFKHTIKFPKGYKKTKENAKKLIELFASFAIMNGAVLVDPKVGGFMRNVSITFKVVSYSEESLSGFERKFNTIKTHIDVMIDTHQSL